MFIEFLAAGAEAAPENHFGFFEALEQGGIIAYSIFGVLVIMSVGSFYILITKLLEQRKIFNQYKERAHQVLAGPFHPGRRKPSSTRTAHGASWSTTALPPKISTAR